MLLFDAVVSKLPDFVGDNLAEKATNTAAAAMDRQKLKEQVQDLAERYRPQFEALSLKEEFDFEGLNAFLQENLFPRVAACFNAPEREQREDAKQTLFASAYHYAGASTVDKENAVRHYLELFLEVVEGFFLEQVGNEKWFLCGRAVDEVDKMVKAYLQQQTAQITEVIERHDSFAEYIDNIQPPVTTTNRFHYRNTELGFYGREQEIEDLNAFLDRNEQILWMAVVGDGGVGKSKLLYHFCDQTSNRPGWKTVWFGTNSSKKVNEYQNWYYPVGLLVVADYAGELAEQLGDWLAKLAVIAPSCRPRRLRLILLERENLGETDPLWYQTFTGGRERRRAVERFRTDPSCPCMKLPGLGDESLGALVQDYARSEKGRELTQTELSSVLEKAHEIERNDPTPHPLVTLLITDAVLEGKQPGQWDMDALVENIIERYQDHWRSTVCKGDEKLYDALEQVLVYATAVGGWDLTELPGPLEAASERLLDSARVLEPLVQAVNEESTFRGRLSPLEPDLVGEFYVLDYLNDKRYVKSKLAALVRLFWEQKGEFVVFLIRSIQNYCNEKRFQALFQDGMAVFQPEERDTFNVVWFARLLFNLSNEQPPQEAEKTVEKLKTVSSQHPNSAEIAGAYARGLYNLSNKQPLEEREKTVDKLELVSNQHPDSDEIALAYAMGLFNLSNKQSTAERKKTIDKLETVTNQHPNSNEIALRYAKGLFNHSCDLSPEEEEKIVDKLEALTKQHPDSGEIALRYAWGLFNLSCDQSSGNVEKTVAKLERLANQHPAFDEISCEYAKGLSNLSCGQTSGDAEKTVAKLERLANQHPASVEIALSFAYSLFNLSCDQSPEEAAPTIDRLAELAAKHPNSAEIAHQYATGLFNLSIDQSLEEAAKTIAKVGELVEQHPDSAEIADLYTEALDDLAQRQSQE